MRWVWSPYVACGSCTAFYKVYPGDAYVDWVALDGYNWGTSQSWSSWQTMAQIFPKSYDAVTRLAPRKPFMIAEIAPPEVGGNKPACIPKPFFKPTPDRMPKTGRSSWSSGTKKPNGR